MITIKEMLGTAFLLIIAFLVNMFFIAIKRNVVHHHLNVHLTKKNNAQLKVFFISDIHRRKIDDKLLRKIDHDIDIVIIGGDLVEKGVPLARISKNIQKLASLGPVFFVWGNNDREVGEANIREILAQFNGKVLDNESRTIPGHPSWKICGTDDPSSRNVDLESTLQGINEDDNVIFVSHQPKVCRKAELLFRPTLMLAGHTHGGQIRFGKLGLFEKGTFQERLGCGKLISNGYGTSTVPLRFGVLPECHIITMNYTDSALKER